MPRVHFVKSARKDNPVAKVGESYFWWKFRYGGKRYSRTRPLPSQLTQSEYFGRIRAAIEEIEAYGLSEPDDIESLRDDIVSTLEELRDEQEEKRDNMPESLQDSPTGELLQDRYDALEGAVSTIEGIDAESFESEYREDTDGYNEDLQEWLEEQRSEMIDAVSECEI